jgi:hypothetical protein
VRADGVPARFVPDDGDLCIASLANGAFTLDGSVGGMRDPIDEALAEISR